MLNMNTSQMKPINTVQWNINDYLKPQNELKLLIGTHVMHNPKI